MRMTSQESLSDAEVSITKKNNEIEELTRTLEQIKSSKLEVEQK